MQKRTPLSLIPLLLILQCQFLVRATIVPLGTDLPTISGPATSPPCPMTVARGKKVPKKKRRVTVSDVQKAQTEVLELEKEKLKVEIENVKLIKEELKMELEEMKAKFLY